MAKKKVEEATEEEVEVKLQEAPMEDVTLAEDADLKLYDAGEKVSKSTKRITVTVDVMSILKCSVLEGYLKDNMQLILNQFGVPTKIVKVSGIVVGAASAKDGIIKKK